MQKPSVIEIAVVIRDLIFETKIKATAAAVGSSIHITRTGAELSRLLETAPVSRVIVDLNSAGPAAFEAIQAARLAGIGHILAYVSHVDTDLAARAAEAGAHEVMPRSRFVTRLPALLGGVSTDLVQRQGSDNDGPGHV